MEIRRLLLKFGAIFLVLMLAGLLGLSPALADVTPQSPANATIGVTPNSANNSGTEVLHFNWDVWDWVGTATHYTFQVSNSGSLVPIYIQYSDVAGVDNFPGINVPLQNIAGTVGSLTTHLFQPENPLTHNWTVPGTFAPGSYWAIVNLYVQGKTQAEASALISFNILQATGTLNIIKLHSGSLAPLQGWQFNVTGPQALAGATGPSGNLTFANIPIGQYTVTETLQGGWVNTVPGGSAPYQLIGNVPFNGTATVTFHNTENVGNLHIFKYNDLNGDGNYDPGDGETGLNGWHFSVTGPQAMNGDTSGGGNLSFNNIPTGTYTITETIQSGWRCTDPGSSGQQSGVGVTLGNTTSVDFGNQQYGNIDIFKYNDIDGNGIFDGADYPLSGWDFNVTGAANNPYTTGGSGHVIVPNLVPGNHSVTEDTPLPPSWFNTDPGGPAPYDEVVNVPTGGTASVDFGNQQREVTVPSLGQWGILAMSGALGLLLLATIAWRRRAVAR